ncbi:MAG TPA: glycosyltransferase family 2 protein [Thermoanaerobaculia bacterium]|nr:glycosyltransferase family 2 protein [Thermoanaerobaculia bacterium]
MRVLAAIVLVAWALALIRTLVNLLLIPRLRRGAPTAGPRVSVIIPARDEERRIELTVRAFLSQTYEDFEVIVVNDRSTDATAAILERIARQNERLVVVSGEEPPPGWLGKPWALHQGSRRATGELLLFVDADIFYAPETLGAAVEEMEKSRVAMVCLLPYVEMAGFWEHVAMPMLSITVFTFLPTWLANRTTIQLLSIGGGTGNLIRRRDYEEVGGHETLKDAVVDDVGLARIVRRSGRKTSAVRADDFVSVRMYHGGNEIVDGFTKNMFAVLGRRYGFAALSVAAGFVFHILPYILAVLGYGFAIATVVLITISRGVLFQQLRYRFHYALWAHPLMVVFWGWITIRSAWFTGIRRRLLWRGRVYDASSTRFGGDQ